MKFLEKDLEEVIFNASNRALEVRGLHGVYNNRKRQLKIGNYGVADIVCMQRETCWDGISPETYFVESNIIRINLLELKQETISISAFLQAVRYMKGIQRYIFNRGIFEDCEREYTITLVGRKIDMSSDLVYIPDILSDDYFSIRLFTYEFDLEDGLIFTEHSGYALTNEGFKFPRK